MTEIIFESSYTVQPGDTYKTIPEKAFEHGDRRPEIRLENGTRLTSPDSPQLQPGQTVYLPIKIGQRYHPPSGYGRGDDFLSADELSPLSPFLKQFYRGVIRNSPANFIINRRVIQPLMEYFLSGKGGVYQHGTDSPLSRLVESSKPFNWAFARVVSQLENWLNSRDKVNPIDVGKLDVSIPHFDFKPGKADLTLFAAIGGIQGADLLLNRLVLTPDSRYFADLFIVIYDDFGLGKDDRYTPSLYAAWNLQHRGGAKAFVNEIIVNKTVAGTLKSSEDLTAAV